MYHNLFDDVKEIRDSRQVIDDTPTTKDMLMDDKLCSNTYKKDKKNFFDIITKETHIHHISFDHVPM